MVGERTWTREDRLLLGHIHEIGGRDRGTKDGQEALQHSKTAKRGIKSKAQPIQDEAGSEME